MSAFFIARHLVNAQQEQFDDFRTKCLNWLVANSART
jgi:hypothetical protein